MPKRTTTIAELLGALSEDSPAGFAIALHITYATPAYLFQTYPIAWMDEYSARGLLMSDPTVAWGFHNTGMVRWSDLAEQDTAGVFKLSASYGLVYGICVSVTSGEQRSVASFARSDREFTDAEAAQIESHLIALHAVTAGSDSLDESDREALKDMSIRLTHA